MNLTLHRCDKGQINDKGNDKGHSLVALRKDKEIRVKNIFYFFRYYYILHRIHITLITLITLILYSVYGD
jgi:hypothetical protein